MKMKRNGKQNGTKNLIAGTMLLAAFAIWTAMICLIDVQPLGQNGTDIGFATLNVWFHQVTGAHMVLYVITDWLGLIPIFVCMVFGGIGLMQLIKRRSLWKVDTDIIFLGVYYIIVIIGYLVFEMIPINYRPVLINGIMEVSYPSSTTLLVLCVMPTLVEQTSRRVKNKTINTVTQLLMFAFSAFMVTGRLLSGVHWLTDIVGAVLLSAGLFCMYKGVVLFGKKVVCEENVTKQI